MKRLGILPKDPTLLEHGKSRMEPVVIALVGLEFARVGGWNGVVSGGNPIISAPSSNTCQTGIVLAHASRSGGCCDAAALQL